MLLDVQNAAQLDRNIISEADLILAQFLADVSSAWESATAEQQNKLARALFEIWSKDKEVVFVKPRPELDPLFRLNYEESTRKAVEGVTSTRVEFGLTPYLRNPASATGVVGVEMMATRKRSKCL